MGNNRDNIADIAVRRRASFILREMRRRSKRKGFSPPEFTQKDIIDILVNGKCAVTGRGFSLVNKTKYKKDPFIASPDRQQNDKGYTRKNTKFVCWYINNIRGVYDLKDFKKWIKGVRW